MHDNTPITIAGILEMTPGTKEKPVWINQPFTASLQEVQQRQPKSGKGPAFYTGTLIDQDTGASIGFSAFGRKFMPPQGTLVEISGQGTSLTEYNGANQLTIGQKAVVGTIAAVSRGSTQRDEPLPRQTTERAAPVQGQTVGMAINNAALDARVLHEAGALDLNDSAAVKKFVWIRASVYIAVAKQLELGNLANTTTAAPKADPAPAEDDCPPETEPETPPPAAQRQPPARGFPRQAPADNPHGYAFPPSAEETDVSF